VIYHIKQINALHVLLNICRTFANIEVKRVIECSNMSVYTSNQIIKFREQTISDTDILCCQQHNNN